MFVVSARADVSADLMQDGGDFKEKDIMFIELVKVMEVCDEMLAKFSDIFAVAGIGLVAL
jgi:hypothetical protein